MRCEPSACLVRIRDDFASFFGRACAVLGKVSLANIPCMRAVHALKSSSTDTTAKLVSFAIHRLSGVLGAAGVSRVGIWLVVVVRVASRGEVEQIGGRERVQKGFVAFSRDHSLIWKAILGLYNLLTAIWHIHGQFFGILEAMGESPDAGIATQ